MFTIQQARYLLGGRNRPVSRQAVRQLYERGRITGHIDEVTGKVMLDEASVLAYRNEKARKLAEELRALEQEASGDAA